MDCEVAEAMDWPVTAWALLLCTPVAVAWALEAEGAKEAVLLAADADRLWDEFVLCAEAADREAAADCGVLRAELRPEAAWQRIVKWPAPWFGWPAPACRWPARTLWRLAMRKQGKGSSVTRSLHSRWGLVLLAAEADWVLVDCVVLRTALLLAAEEALGWALAALMLWLETACARWFAQKHWPAAEGERLALSPAALGAEAEAWAAADCAAACGLFRRNCGRRLIARWAGGGWLMVWLVSERAWPAMTLALACERREQRRHYWRPRRNWGPLRKRCYRRRIGRWKRHSRIAALSVPVRRDCAMEELEAAAAMGVSRMLLRISLLISCTADSSPSSEMVICCSPGCSRVLTTTQFFS